MKEKELWTHFFQYENYSILFLGVSDLGNMKKGKKFFESGKAGLNSSKLGIFLDRRMQDIYTN